MLIVVSRILKHFIQPAELGIHICYVYCVWCNILFRSFFGYIFISFNSFFNSHFKVCVVAIEVTISNMNDPVKIINPPKMNVYWYTPDRSFRNPRKIKKKFELDKCFYWLLWSVNDLTAFRSNVVTINLKGILYKNIWHQGGSTYLWNISHYVAKSKSWNATLNALWVWIMM